MTLNTRRALSVIFILIFIIITPAIMLYAAGYKMSKNGFSIQRTGIFIIDSKPEGAKIYINGKIQEKWPKLIFGKNKFISTPAKIKNLLPGEYDVKLELDGCWNWQKKLTINPGDSTFAENIYLFKNSLPAQIISENIESINVSPEKNQAVILSRDMITFLNLKNESKKQVKISESEEKNIIRSENMNKIIIGDYLYDTSNSQYPSQNLKKLYKNSFNYKFGEENLYYREKNSIYKIEKSGLPKKIISDKTFSDYSVKNGIIYLITESDRATSLEVINESNSQSVKNINLPYSADYSFINEEQDIINIYDKNGEILCLIDFSSPYNQFAEIINNVKTTFWADSKKMLYANDFEIWLYNSETKNKILITRISNEINDAIMHKSGDYIIYSTKQTINAVELDEREKRNITELVRFDSIGSFELSEDDVLYFSGKTGNFHGLYKFLMQ